MRFIPALFQHLVRLDGLSTEERGPAYPHPQHDGHADQQHANPEDEHHTYSPNVRTRAVLRIHGFNRSSKEHHQQHDAAQQRSQELAEKFLALANSSPRKYQTQAKAVSP